MGAELISRLPLELQPYTYQIVYVMPFWWWYNGLIIINLEYANKSKEITNIYKSDSQLKVLHVSI